MNGRFRLLIIGGSAGSLEVIMRIIPSLQTQTGFAIVLVMHRKGHDSQLAELLSDKTDWEVREAEEKDRIEAGTIYIAPADYHLLIEKDGTLSLDYSEKLHYSRPSIDISFETAAEAYGDSLAGLLLSGANADGAEGLKQIREHGGYTMAQEPSDSSVGYMPQQAINLFPVDKILRIDAMSTHINHLND